MSKTNGHGQWQEIGKGFQSLRANTWVFKDEHGNILLRVGRRKQTFSYWSYIWCLNNKQITGLKAAELLKGSI